MWKADGERVEVLDVLPTEGQQTVDLPVLLGARKQVQARLSAKQMPEEVVKRRREQRKRASAQTLQADQLTAVGTGAVDDCADHCAALEALGG